MEQPHECPHCQKGLGCHPGPQGGLPQALKQITREGLYLVLKAKLKGVTPVGKKMELTFTGSPLNDPVWNTGSLASLYNYKAESLNNENKRL